LWVVFPDEVKSAALEVGERDRLVHIEPGEDPFEKFLVVRVSRERN
jgi:hypothetical protein